MNVNDMKSQYGILRVGFLSNNHEYSEFIPDMTMIKSSDATVGSVVHVTADYYDDCPYPLLVTSKNKQYVKVKDIHRGTDFNLSLRTKLFVRDYRSNVENVPRGWKLLDSDNHPEDYKDFLFVPLNFRESGQKACVYFMSDDMMYGTGGCGQNPEVGFYKYVSDFTPK